MKTVGTLKKYLGIAFLMALLFISCAKEPLDAPAGYTGDLSKDLSTPPTVDDPANGGTVGNGRDGDTGSISDDGDDVGDGERNKKKKPN